MQKLREDSGIASRALELTILTAARTSEVMKAECSEIDLDLKTWIVPAERMKSKREHRVPLSDAAVAVLQAVQGRSSGFVFSGHKRNTHLSNAAMLKVLRRLKQTDITVHGFRSTCRDWCAESTNYSANVAEMALAHTVRDKTEAAYRRGDLFEKRARLMADWARYCSQPSKSADIIRFREQSG